MGPVEFYFATIATIVTLIGLARGYAKELGSTMIILVAIFLLLFLEERINPLLSSTRSLIFDDASVSEPLFLSVIYQTAFVAAVFAGYAGKTITFAGRPVPPPQGRILDLLIGALNGYLVAGTLWYYQQAYGYPFGVFGSVNPADNPSTQAVIQLLPQYLLPSATLWMVPIAVLLLLRVRG